MTTAIVAAVTMLADRRLHALAALLALLAGLLGDAEVVAYPSLGEGFGLPVLEAMARDLPVATGGREAGPRPRGALGVVRPGGTTPGRK